MPAKFGAGQMSSLVAFDKREPVSDNYGNEIAGWVEQFQARAKVITQRVSEIVQAEAQTSRAMTIVQVWASVQALAVGTDGWRMRDVRSGTVYNIRSTSVDKTRRLVDLLCESNVAAG